MQSVFAMSADVSIVTQWTALVMSVPAMIEVAFAMAKLVASTYQVVTAFTSKTSTGC
jgi:predicted tellurium resistance membrane protein TerC